jgi:methyl-accepting chemotaxis protein
MMNFDKAISDHAHWKIKLSNYLKNPDHSLQSAEIALDDHCDLGKWIAGEGKQFASLPEYATLKSDHSRFHKVAADIVRRADSGQSVSEEVAIGGKSEFNTVSSAIVRSLVALRFKVVPVSTR